MFKVSFYVLPNFLFSNLQAPYPARRFLPEVDFPNALDGSAYWITADQSRVFRFGGSGKKGKVNRNGLVAVNFKSRYDQVLLFYLKVAACREEGKHTFRNRPYFQPVIGFKTLNGKGNGSRNDDQCSFRGRGSENSSPGMTGLFRRIASEKADQKVRVYQQAGILHG
jgi:hypothetical protein